MAERLVVTTTIGSKTVDLLSTSPLLLYRSLTMHTKEPETNRWIQTIPNNGIFFDVGANVGIYSIYASAYCSKVFAFEPSYLNYNVLNHNIMLNKLQNNISAYCIAINDRTRFDSMRLSSATIGSAHHTFGSNMDTCHREFEPHFLQGSIGMSLDDLIYEFGFECPTFLKIDVDGNEHLVVNGALKLLEDPRLTSVLIELNNDLKIDHGTIEQIRRAGFEIVETGANATFGGMSICNLIFRRTSQR